MDIKTPYKISGALTDGYLWKEVHNKIFIRHKSSSRVFQLSAHPGKREMYLIQNYPLAVETNNISAQNIAIVLRDYKEEAERETEALRNETEALRKENREENREAHEELERKDGFLKKKEEIIENLAKLSIKKRKQVETECYNAREFIMNGKGNLVFKTLSPDLLQAIVSVKSSIVSIKKSMETLEIAKEEAIREQKRQLEIRNYVVARNKKKAAEKIALRDNVILRNNTILKEILSVLNKVVITMDELATSNKEKNNKNIQESHNLILHENRLLLSVLYDDTLRMMEQVVEGDASNNPKYGYSLSRKYPNRLAVVSIRLNIHGNRL